MSDPKKDDKKAPPPGDKKVSPEDLDKTVIDVKVEDLDRVLEETLIFERPPLDEEDTDLHGEKTKPQIVTPTPSPEESTRILHREETGLTPETPQEQEAPPPKEKEQPPPKPKKEKKVKPVKVKEEKSISRREGPPQSFVTKALEFLLGVVFLFALLDASIEGLSVASPLRMITVGLTLLSILLTFFFIVRKGFFQLGPEIGVCALLLLFSYSTWKYGSSDPEALTILKYPPAQIFNLVFLGVHLFVLGVLIFQFRGHLLLKAVLSLLILYGSLGFAENLIRVFTFSRAWNLEDTLLGSPLWAFVPWYYLRPVVFSFWVLFPLLILTFLVLKVSSGAALPPRRNGFVLVLLLLSFLLGNILLQNNRVPNFISLLINPTLGVGRAQAISASGGLLDYDLEVSTSNAPNERLNDANLLYRMGAVFYPSADNKKLINVIVRNRAGHAVPFLSTKDLTVIQEQAVQKPIRVRMRQENFLEPKSLAVLVDRSTPMAPFSSFIEGALQGLYGLTNSKEKVYAASFAEDLKIGWVRSRGELKKTFLTPSGQGTRNLDVAFTKALPVLEKDSSSKALFLLTSGDALISEDLLAKLSSRLKTAKIKFYSFSLGSEQAPDSLKRLAEGSGGRALGVQNGKNLPLALLGGFADAFGEYQIAYEGQSFTPKLKIISPEEGAEIIRDTPLTLKILNAPDVRVKSARLSVDGKPIQEIPAQGLPEVSFTLSPQILPRGSHVFKATVIAEDGKEYSQEIKLTISQELDFRFIRPLEGDVVSGQVNLEVYFKSFEQNPLMRVDFLIDGQKVGEASSEPYLFTWESQSQGGSHTIQAMGVFADGSTKTDQIKVNVLPGFFLRIVSPSVGEFLSNLTEIEADVSHSLSEIVQKVEFYADGELLGEVTQPPYKYLWDNSSLASGKHIIQARAFSSANATTTDAVVVNIGSGNLSVQLGDGVSTGGGAFLSPDAMEWVVDASSSMEGRMGPERKIDLVKQALVDILPKIPSNTMVAYRWYGSQSLASHRDCKDSVLASPLKAVDVAKIGQVLAPLEAKGLAPLAFTLEKVKADLKSAAGSRVVILMTDGYDDCGGDPVGQLERWKKEKLNAKLYVIGLDIDGSRAETEIKRLAAISGGQYFPVRNEKDIMAALDEMVKVTYRILDYKDREIGQRAVGAPSLPLRTGEYRIEVDVEPPLVKKVLINNGVEKRLLLRKDGSNFVLDEQ